MILGPSWASLVQIWCGPHTFRGTSFGPGEQAKTGFVNAFHGFQAFAVDMRSVLPRAQWLRSSSCPGAEPGDDSVRVPGREGEDTFWMVRMFGHRSVRSIQRNRLRSWKLIEKWNLMELIMSAFRGPQELSELIHPTLGSSRKGCLKGLSFGSLNEKDITPTRFSEFSKQEPW